MSRGKTGGPWARAYAIPVPPFAGCGPEGSDAGQAKWGRWGDFTALQDELNRLFDDTARRQAGEEGRGDEIERADWKPAADVYETEDAFVVAVDLPGIDRAALEVSVEDNRLTVRGARAAEGGMKLHRGDRPAGRFVSRFGPLPPTVDQKKIAAEYKDGVLRLRLPKRAQRADGKVRIEIK
jgi:HSP20 family protein